MSFDRTAELARLKGVVDSYDGEAGSTTERQADQYAASRAMTAVRGPDVLVLGAATGAWAPGLIEGFGSFDIVDAVAEVIERLEQRYAGQVRGFVSLFEEFEPERKYDTVVMGHVLEHLFDPDHVLRRARTWLKPGGRLVVLVPNANSLHRLVGVQLGVLAKVTAFSAGDIQLGHRRVYTPTTLRAELERAGFAELELAGLILKPLSNQQMDEWSDSLREAFFALGDQMPDVACVLMYVGTDSASG